MNRTEELGHFILTEYDQLNFLLELDVYLNSSKNLTANATTLVNSFYFYEKEQLTMLWILFASIVVGNSSVLIALLLDKGRTSRFNYFIKHLAIADLSVGFVSVLTDIIWKLTIEWNAGNVACKLVRYSQAVVTYSSTYLLVALTIDRYEAIRHPMNFFKSWKRAKFLVISAWILSLLFSIPIIVLYEEKTVQGHLQCWIEFIEPWHWQMYMIIISLTVFFIPAFIIAGCYTTIIYTIWSHPNIQDRKLRRQNMGNPRECTNEELMCKRVSSRGLIPKAKVKTVKMTLIIVFVFIFCWSPYIIFDLLQVFGYVKRTQTNIAVATFIQSLAPLNSAANPIIYCIFSTYICRNLRIFESFQRISKCCCGSKFGKSVKISDTSASTVLSRATSGRYINLHRLNRLDHLSKQDRKILRGKEMTLKNHGTELSRKALAFSVESLLSARSNEDGVLEKTLTVTAKLQIRNGIKAELCGNVLWERFNRIGTEMIVTRAGRRMFPTLKVRLQGLKFTSYYIVYMDITLVGETRYRYNFQRSEWTIAGPSSSHTPNTIYIHPGSPSTGRDWMSQEISFDKVKLTNNRKPLMRDQVSLHSMHKYQPRIHVLETPYTGMSRDALLEYIRENGDKSETFAFEQTAFITVTAYQNQEITNLKIQSNPFAKGFRETLNAKNVMRSVRNLNNQLTEQSIERFNLTREHRGHLSHDSYMSLVCPVDTNHA